MVKEEVAVHRRSERKLELLGRGVGCRSVVECPVSQLGRPDTDLGRPHFRDDPGAGGWGPGGTRDAPSTARGEQVTNVESTPQNNRWQFF